MLGDGGYHTYGMVPPCRGHISVRRRLSSTSYLALGIRHAVYHRMGKWPGPTRLKGLAFIFSNHFRAEEHFPGEEHAAFLESTVIRVRNVGSLTERGLR